MVEFAKFTDAERATVDKIVERAQAEYRAAGTKVPAKMDLQMDIAAVAAHTPLRLEEWLEADPFNFNHDIGGIRQHLNREGSGWAVNESTGCRFTSPTRRNES